MRTTIYILTIILLGTGSCKKRTRGTMTVIKDCTGTYLRFDNKDYHVCNAEKVSNFPTGATVKASFEKISECTGPEGQPVTCYAYHQNEGWINIKKIE